MKITFIQNWYYEAIQNGADTKDKLVDLGRARGAVTQVLSRMEALGLVTVGETIIAHPAEFEVEREDRLATKAEKPKPDRVFVAKTRSCLCCGDDFKSEWEGHRICSACKDLDGWKGQRADNSVVGLHVAW